MNTQSTTIHLTQGLKPNWLKLPYQSLLGLLIYLFVAFSSLQAQTFYGLTAGGGTDNLGAIIKYDVATSILTAPYTFSTLVPGGSPRTTELLEYNGKFYGMTIDGGVNGRGVLFEWNPTTNVYTKKIDFNGTGNGSRPYGSLTLSGGKLYGMTSGGGTFGFGVLFEWDPTTNVCTKKIDFNGTDNGSNPYGSLTLSGGKLYGMTVFGGANDGGVLFEWDPATNVYTKKIDFNYTNGIYPNGSLTLSGDKLYGMTASGGANNAGVLFEWDPATNAYTKKIDFTTANGCSPYGSLTLSGGKFYGMTYRGGANDSGVLFEWNPATNIFTKKIDLDDTNNGRNPQGSLTLSGGKFYGMTELGGANDRGVLFEWDPATNAYAKKIDFNGTNGSNPYGSLTLSGDKMYGMTNSGGANGFGVLFEWDPATNVFTKKIDFEGTGNGSYPWGSLTLSGGKLYGMAQRGGAYNEGEAFEAGVLFEWDPATNIFTKKIDFNGSGNGSNPRGSLTLSEGKFYGMTYSGGSSNGGVLFEWDPATNVFTKKIDFNFATNGNSPYGSLTLSGGKLYGMTSRGGAFGFGVLFEWDPATNVYTKKIDFNATNGSTPFGSLTLSGGKLYGMTQRGGAYNRGVLFEWDPATNVFTKKIDFNGTDNGNLPYGSLTLSGGKLYGMTTFGGASGNGVLFEWDPATNVFTKKVDFNGIANGSLPFGSLTLSGGKLYGMTANGGANDKGVLFEWDPATNTYTKKADFTGDNGAYPQYGALVVYEAPDTAPPTAPVVSTGTLSETSVVLNWTAATDNVGILGYEVFQGTTSLGTVTGLTFTVSGLSAGTAYTFTVKAKDVAGNSSIASNSISVQINLLISTTKPELIFDGLTNTAIGPKSFYLKNTGNAPLTVSSLAFEGLNTNDFSTSAVPLAINPQDSTLINVTFQSSTIGYKEAALRIISNATNEDTLRIGLYGLAVSGLSGNNEPTLINVVKTLGYNINVGWTTLTTAITNDLKGEEQYIPLFEKAGAGLVQIIPLARYSPIERMPFGYYTKNGATITRNLVGTMPSTSPDHQTLFPILLSGTTVFEPNQTVFGFYGTPQSLVETIYTDDALNSNTVNRMRIYPVRNRQGVLVPNQYLLCLEELNNGDYQDYVFLVTNVKPFADTQAPTAPTLSLGTVTSNSVALSWVGATDNTGVVGYDIFNGANLEGTTANLNFTVNNLSPNTAYTFTVKAKDAAGNTSSSSNAVNATTSAAPTSVRFEAETNFTIVSNVGTNGNIVVGNNNIASAGKDLRAFDIGDKFNINFTVPQTGQYRLKVRARSGTIATPTSYWNPLGYSFRLNNTSTTFTPNPSTVSATATTAYGAVGAHFGNVESAIVNLNSGSHTLEITMTRTWLGVDYLDVEFLGGGTPDTQAPSAPTLSLGTVTQTSIALNWTASTDNVGITAYEVFNGTSSVGTTANLNFTVNNLMPNTAYTFTVKAKDAAGNSSTASNGVNTTTLDTSDTQSPSAPTLSLGTVTQTSVALNWTASTDNVGVTGYDIFNGVNLVGTTANLNFTVNNLIPNTAYAFTVKAKDAAGNSSVASNTINANTLTQPTSVRFEAETNFTIVTNAGTNGNIAPANNNIASAGKDLRAYDIGDKFNINFTVPQTGQYRLKVNARSGTIATPTSYWNPLGYSFRLNNTNTTFTPNPSTVSTTATTAYGAVGAYFGNVESGIINLNVGANVLEITMTRTWLGVDYLDVEFIGGGTPDTQAPTASILSLGTVTQTSVALNWTVSTDNVGVTAYEIFNGANLVGSTANLNFTVNNLIPNTTYAFTVKAKDAAGNSSVASNTINTNTLTQPTAVRFEAETNFTIVTNAGTNGNIAPANNNIASAGKDLRAYDIGDKFNINFTVPQTGQYRLKVNARSGTIATPTSYWNPLGYSFRLNNTTIPFTPNPSTVSTTATTAYGAVGAHFGNIESGIVNLNVGANVLEITMTRTWLGVDYLDVEFVGSGVANQTDSEVQVSKTVTLMQDISKLYPNPAGGEDVYVEFNGDVDGKLEYSILDAQGKTFTKETITLDEPQYVIKIAIANLRLSQGVYYLYIKGDKLQEKIIRFVKN